MQNLLPTSSASTSPRAARGVGASAQRDSADAPATGGFEAALEQSRAALVGAVPATTGTAAAARGRLTEEQPADPVPAALPQELLAQALLAMAPVSAAAARADASAQVGTASTRTQDGDAALTLSAAGLPAANAVLLPAALAQTADAAHADGMAAAANAPRPDLLEANTAQAQPGPALPGAAAPMEVASARVPLAGVAQTEDATPAALPASLAAAQTTVAPRPTPSATPAALASLAGHEAASQAQPATAPALTPEAFTLSAAAAPQLAAPATSAAVAAAPAPAAAAYALQPEVGSRAWAPALGQQLVRMDAAGHHVAELSLHPAELGPLRVTLTVHEGLAQAQFVAAHAGVRQAIEAALPQLRTTLADNGISLGQTSVNAESRQSASQEGAFGQNPPRQGSRTAGATAVADASDTATAAARAPAAPLRRLDSRAVDTFA